LICMGLRPETVTGVYPTLSEVFPFPRWEQTGCVITGAVQLVTNWHLFPTSQLHRKVEQTGVCILVPWVLFQG
ncbi:hypothetical protein GOODEAATRI_002466, partial [Goodea atripinnis]